MEYELVIIESALAELRELPKDDRRNIGLKIDQLQHGFAGDVKKLKGFRTKYRLRVGGFRVLFELEGNTLVVYAVGRRKDIYG